MNRFALSVEQDRVFNGVRKHAVFLEPDDEGVWPASETGTMQHRHMEMPRPCTVGGDGHPFQ